MCSDLGDAAAGPRDRLKAAAFEFERAVNAGYRDWPARFRQQADVIRAVLFRHGVPELSVDRMDDAAVRGAIDAMHRFCDEAIPSLEGRRS